MCKIFTLRNSLRKLWSRFVLRLIDYKTDKRGLPDERLLYYFLFDVGDVSLHVGAGLR